MIKTSRFTLRQLLMRCDRTKAPVVCRINLFFCGSSMEYKIFNSNADYTLAAFRYRRASRTLWFIQRLRGNLHVFHFILHIIFIIVSNIHFLLKLSVWLWICKSWKNTMQMLVEPVSLRNSSIFSPWNRENMSMFLAERYNVFCFSNSNWVSNLNAGTMRIRYLWQPLNWKVIK